MYIYLSKKIAIPNNTIIRSLAWNKEQGYIACGGEGGLLKVLKLDMGREGMVRGVAAPSNLSMNQTLEGHTGQVEVVTWNESFLKLTSSDQNGLIIVWMLYKGSWYEEMINNRNKSVVRGMAWNSDGQKICIVYEDGAVIVGSVDGNRIWGKELKGMQLTHVEWSPDGKMILFGMGNGEVHIYEHSGLYMAKVPIACQQSSQLIGLHWYCGHQDSEAFSLAIAFQSGQLQLMRNESDESPKLVDTELEAAWLQWNYDGTLLAITGQSGDIHGELGGEKRNLVKFYNSTGQLLHTLRIPGRNIGCCSWEGGGLRIALAVDSFIFFANIRPDYKWCYFSNTVVYSINKSDKVESTVIFWNIHTNEKHMKYVKYLLDIAAAGEFCTLFTKTDDGSGQYAVILCNSIGTPVDSHYMDIRPCHVAMNSTQVFAASKEHIYMWHFQTPRGKTLLEISGVYRSKQASATGQEKMCHIDDTPSGIMESANDISHDAQNRKSFTTTTSNPISCITATEKVLVVGRESGTFQRYTLPHLALTHRYTVECQPQKIRLNANNSRMAIIDITGVLLLYDLNSKMASVKDSSGGGELLKFERKDVWDVMWASDNNDMFVALEKTRMYIYRDLDPEEPIMCSGYLCSFDSLVVKAVLLDDLILDPENPVGSDFLVEYEVKSLRDTRDLISKVGIGEASKFIEENSHPKLWTLLAEAALKELDFVTAENAFVRSKDYGSIQFVKRAAALQNSNMKKAEVALFFKEFDKVEKLYMEMDRRDLAVGMRQLIGDWFRVVQLLKTGNINGRQLEQAWGAIGDFYCDRQKWENAVNYYEQAHSLEQLASCHYMLEDYDKLEQLAQQLPEGHSLLQEMGSMFESVGMCNQAVEAYLKAGLAERAVECCIQLSHWSRALELARTTDGDISGLLGQYGHHLLAAGKTLPAVELYRKAGRHLDAAHLMGQVMEEATKRQLSYLQMKKLHVLAAMLVEEHDQNTRSRKPANDRSVAAAISALLKDEVSNRLLDQPWRGAEAYHFLVLGLSQLYDGYVDAAMKTALHLREYEDILNPETIYAILALASCANRAFGTCSKAFIKLESLPEISESQKKAYEELAVEIFLKHPPKDSRGTKSECATCETMIPDWCSVCPNCTTKFPICVASGRPIMDSSQQWMCHNCKHCAFRQDMVARQHCPLCHSPVS